MFCFFINYKLCDIFGEGWCEFPKRCLTLLLLLLLLLLLGMSATEIQTSQVDSTWNISVLHTKVAVL